jgi:hypothetical protein
MRRNKDRK